MKGLGSVRVARSIIAALGVTLCLPGSALAAPVSSPAAGGTAPSHLRCAYTKDGTKPARDVGIPRYDEDRAGPYHAVLHTNHGRVVVRAFTWDAPCTTYSFRYLIRHGFYDQTPCHRLVTKRIYVLQCGDPTGKGDGGPGYKFPDENLDGATYPAGTVAMANDGPDTNGSQFFFVYKDTKLPPKYTPFGWVVGGMRTLREIAAAGDDGANGPGDGHPKSPTQIEWVSVRHW